MTLEPDPALSERDRVKKATAMLNAVGLGEHLNYRPAQLSVDSASASRLPVRWFITPSWFWLMNLLPRWIK